MRHSAGNSMTRFGGRYFMLKIDVIGNPGGSMMLSDRKFVSTNSFTQ